MTNVDDVLHLSEISQIAITVSDLKRAQSFYQNTLGMRFLFESGTMVFPVRCDSADDRSVQRRSCEPRHDSLFQGEGYSGGTWCFEEERR